MLADDWAAWRWAGLRGGGFAAPLILRLASEAAAAAADRLLTADRAVADARRSALDALRAFAKRESTAEARVAVRNAYRDLLKGVVPLEAVLPGASCEELESLRRATDKAELVSREYDTIFASERTKLSSALRELAVEPRLREAITWQNRHILVHAIDPLLRSSPDKMRARDRMHEGVLVSYLQRYCTKNDMIGFFGPMGWARIEPEAEGIRVTPGRSLLGSRKVYFEHWTIDALAEAIARDPRLKNWIAPRRLPFVRVEGTVAHSSLNGRHELDPQLAALLLACDGQTPARDLLAHGTASIDALEFLAEKQLISWSFSIPMRMNPEVALRQQLERIGDDALRAEMLERLATLERARQAVEDSAGDAPKLDHALAALEAGFAALTSREPTRNAGKMYASRGLIFEDCRRDLEVVIGRRVVEGFAPALALVLNSARWLTFETGVAYRTAFRTLFHELVGDAPAEKRRIPFTEFWARAQRLIFGTKSRPVDEILSQVEQKWATLLGARSDERIVRHASAELASGVRRAFSAPHPGWRGACYQSPDLMIAAPSVEAIARGEGLFVLGELHVAFVTLSDLYLHPSPGDLMDATERDLPDPRVWYVTPKNWRWATVRTIPQLVSSKDFFMETAFDPSGAEPDRVLAAADLLVEESETGGHLVVRTKDRRMALEIVEFLGDVLGAQLVNRFRLLPSASHIPRVMIDRLVVCRETWATSANEMPFDPEQSEPQLFVAMRRWAHEQGMPRFVFIKAAIEEKPFFLDFDSPLLVRLFARVLRRAKSEGAGQTAIVVSEMLPGLEETWLVDAADNRYTCELRLVSVDQTVNALITR